MPRRHRAFGKLQTRIIIVVLIFFGTWVVYMLRVNIHLAAIAMIPQKTAIMHEANCSLVTTVYLEKGHNLTSYIAPSSSLNRTDLYYWLPDKVGLIYASYYIGYVISAILGHVVSVKYGCRWLIFITTIIMAVLHMLTSVLASIGWTLVCICRGIMGTCSGFIIPALHLVIGNWAPPQEIHLFIWAMLGGTVGVIFTWSTSAIIIQSGIEWEITFFYSGALALFWCVFWILFAYDTPEEHPWISAEEMEYISSSVAPNPCIWAEGQVPWGRVLCSASFWGLLLLQYSNMAFLNFLLIESPELLKSYLGYNYIQSGFLSSVLFVCRLLGGFIFRCIAEYIKKKNWIGMTNFRKLFTLISHVTPGIILLCFWYIECHPVTAVGMLTLSIILNGAIVATSLTNAHDLAPSYSGTLNDAVNWISMLSGIIVPETTGWLLAYEYSGRRWNIIIMTLGAQLLIAGLLFIILGKGEVQPWNELKEEPSHDEDLEPDETIEEEEEEE